MKLQYTPEAIADLQNIKDYIRNNLHNPSAAKRIPQMILDQCSQLKSFPRMGTDLSAVLGCETNLCMLVCKNYIVIYRYGQNVVFIARVFHGRQDFIRILFGSDILNTANSSDS